MKFMTSQMVYLLHEEGNKRNLVLLFRFFAALIALVVAYSVVFHYIMIREDRSYSWITGLYWTRHRDRPGWRALSKFFTQIPRSKSAMGSCYSIQMTSVH